MKVIVIRSELDKVFSAGADMKSFAKLDLSYRDNSFNPREFARLVRSFHKPLISIIKGLALGAASELAFLSDIVLCSPDALFGYP